MSNKDLVDRYFRELDAEAERYKDKQMDEPMRITSDYCIGQVVRMCHSPDAVPGYITAIVVRPGAIVYWVTWCDSRSSTSHYDFELAPYDEPTTCY